MSLATPTSDPLALAALLRSGAAAFRAFPGPALLYFALAWAWNWYTFPTTMVVGALAPLSLQSATIGEVVPAIVAGAVSGWLVLGISRVAILGARGETASWGDARTSAADCLQCAIVFVVAGVGMLIGALFFVLPGILLMLRWSQSFYLLLDHRARWLSSLGASSRLTKGHRGKILALYSLLALLALPGVALVVWAMWSVIPSGEVIPVMALARRQAESQTVLVTFTPLAHRLMTLGNMLNIALYLYASYVAAALYVALQRKAAALDEGGAGATPGLSTAGPRE